MRHHKEVRKQKFKLIFSLRPGSGRKKLIYGETCSMYNEGNYSWKKYALSKGVALSSETY